MQNTKHTKIGYTVPTMIFIASMFMMTSLAIFCGIVYVHNSYQASMPAKKPSGSLGKIGSMPMEVIEETYGPVNQKALLETKEGLFARIRAARQGCSPCVPQRQQACYSQVSRSYGTSYYWYANTNPVAPSYPQPYQPANQPMQPAPHYVQPNPLKIQPSSENNCIDGSCSPQASIQSSVPAPPEATELYYVLAIKPSL